MGELEQPNVLLTPAQRELQLSALRFARASLQYDMRDAEHAKAFSRDGWKKCAEFGVQGLPFPSELGGQGMNAGSTIAVMEALGYACSDHGLLFSINAHMWACAMPILEFGSDVLKRKYLPRLCDGTLIAANAASEPNAGSDVFSMKATATRSEDHYVISGTKTFVTNAPVADVFVLYATLNPSWGAAGVTAFVVERDTPGLMISKPFEKMGLVTSPMAEVTLDGCRVPVENRIGREGRGVQVFNQSLEWERACILASTVGMMSRQLERCVAHATDRKQFGERIAAFQAVSHRLVEMRARRDIAQLLVYRVAKLKDDGHNATAAAATAKLYVSEAATLSSLDAIRTFGGYGFMREYEVERQLRDSVGGLLYSGTNDVQRNIIAASMRL
jgi:alkylation response protein AidB-like acyl-CoA dehydrogenase